MKSAPSYRLLLIVLFIIAGSVASAQDNATKKFLDSLKTPAPATVTLVDSTAAVVDSAVNMVENDEAEDTETSMPADTAIISNARYINPDTLRFIKKDKGFYYQHWLDSLLRAEKVKIAEPTPQLPDLSLFFNIFQVVLWVLAAAVVLFVLYKLFLGKNAIFIKNSKNIDAEIAIEEEIPAGRYESFIAKAEAESNYRLAVRYLHLQALYNLSEKGYVKVGTEKTNYEYLNELRKGPAAIQYQFSQLTYKYEYIWYGEYPVSSDMYLSLRGQFDAFSKQITTT